ncbi:hypothetical protein E4T43_03035 [Aureobasidium subglaciale]|nr:hypothetical protein E4T43_03035 [Aureobasidium subglaciale]
MSRSLSGIRPCIVISLSHVLAVRTRAASKTVWTQSAPEAITQHSVIHSRLIVTLRRANLHVPPCALRTITGFGSERDIQETTRL